MEHPLKTLWEPPSRLVIGFMSGTSADGVDAALVRITGYGTQTRAEQLGFRFVPFSDEVRAEILRLAGGGPASAADFCRMNFLLGELFCEAGDALCAQTGTKLSDIDLIGSHGQTFWHIPEKEEYLSRTFASTFQLGEEAVLAERFGCPIVGNFRVRDVAAGGLGAPLVPYTEFLLYRSETEHTALQNIGGIGNITLLPAGCALPDVTAFDTGPGNMLIDAAIARITNGEKRYDANGAMAASGRVSEALLAQLMRDPYLSRRPPKTTGREHYGAAFVDGIFAAANERKLSDADILATVTDFTAQTIAAAIRDFCAVRPARLIVGGGGSRNGTLMADIAAALPDVRVLTNEDLGFDGDAKEAVAFAVLANEAIFARCSNARATRSDLSQKSQLCAPGQWSNRCARLSDTRCAEKRSFAAYSPSCSPQDRYSPGASPESRSARTKRSSFGGTAFSSPKMAAISDSCREIERRSTVRRRSQTPEKLAAPA